MPITARVGVFLRHPFHSTFLGPLTEKLRTGLEARMFHDLDTIADFRPDVVISAESIAYMHLRKRFPWARFVHTRHGLADKGVPAQSFRAADHVCVTTDWMRERFERRGIRPRRGFWTCGYIQMDGLAGIPVRGKASKTVLYAPTFQRHLSSIPMVGAALEDWLPVGDPEMRLIIRPHPLTHTEFPDWLAGVRALAARDSRVELAEGSVDVMALLPRADVLVSDASSVFLEFLALDRPIVLIDNEERFKDVRFDASGLEWEFRGCAVTTGTAEAIPGLVKAALSGNDALAGERRRCRDLLFGSTLDGKVGERIANAVFRLEPGRLSMRLPEAFKRLWPRISDRLLTLGYQASTLGRRALQA